MSQASEQVARQFANAAANKNTWGTILYNVKAYGAKGDGVTNDSVKIQTTLDAVNAVGGGTVYFPPGTYYVTEHMRIHANTTLWLAEQATVKRGPTGGAFLNGILGDDSYSSGHDGDGNITILGGTFDLNGAGAIFPIAHAENIYVEGVTFKNAHDGHFFELSACKNVKILNCHFMDQTADNVDSAYEMIQIEQSTSDGFPAFGSWDLTPTVDVLVSGCTFERGVVGVGSHGAMYDTEGNQIFQDNIRVVDSLFTGMTDDCIRAESWRNSVISNNIFRDCDDDGIPTYASNELLIVNNVFEGIAGDGVYIVQRENTGVSFLEPAVNIEVSNNIFKNIGSNAIQVSDSHDIRLLNNDIWDVPDIGIFLDTADNVVCRGNRLRGVGTTTNNTISAIFVSACTDCDIVQNDISNEGYTNNYKYGVNIDSASTDIRVNLNTIDNGGTGRIVDQETTGANEIEFQRYLTAIVTQSSGTVTLRDNINNYRYLIVATGTAGGTIQHSIARGWYASGFRAGTDVVHVNTNTGKFTAMVTSETLLTISTANDALRYIIGVK